MSLNARAHGRLQHDVGIAARDCLGAAMKLWRHLLRPLHSDVIRQEAIHTAHPRKCFTLKRCIEVHHLHERVHARIGAARAIGDDALTRRQARELAQRIFQLVLQGVATLLALPAEVARA